jgi:hypothetical protein
MSKVILSCALTLICSGLMALSGFGVTPVLTLDTVAPVLNLLVPNGGEEWYVGDTRNILWSGSDTNPATNPVSIWYSLNGGVNYTSIVSGTPNDGTHPWLLPTAQTYAGKVRVSFADAYGHITQDASSAVFSITFAPPKPPQDMAIELQNGSNVILSWSPVTQTIYNTPLTPDGYLVFDSEAPGSEDNFSFLWYVTGATSFIHPNVARFSDRMFYHIVAYKDFGGRMAQYLSEAVLDPNHKITYADLKNEIRSWKGGDR